MGKKSRRNRQSSKVAGQKQQALQLDLSNPLDVNIKKKVELRDQYKPLLTETIEQQPRTIKDFAKYECRVIRRNVAKCLIESLEENINILMNIKLGNIKDMDLETYDTSFECKISNIKFLSHLHNNNLPKATKYYIKWKEYMSRKLDKLMFNDCSDEYMEFDGKRIDADKDEAVRLMGEFIKQEVKQYSKMWGVIFDAVIPE